MIQKLRIVKDDISPGDLVLYKTNYNAGLYTVIYWCKGFWGKPNGKVHISGFVHAHDGSAFRHETDVYPVEMLKVENAKLPSGSEVSPSYGSR